MQFPVAMIRQIVFGAHNMGLDLQEILDDVGLSESDLANSNAKLHWQQGIKVWQKVLSATADQDFGLKVGQYVTTSMAGLVGHIMERSKNLFDASQVLQEYLALANEMFIFHSELKNRHLVIFIHPIDIWKINSPETAHQAVIMSFSSVIHIVRLLTGQHIKPQRVDFSFPQPENIEAFRALFQSELRFNQRQDRMFFKESDAFTPVIGYNQEILDTLLGLASQKLKELKQQPSTRSIVEKWVFKNWQKGFPHISRVSEDLHMSVRTLQRRLNQEKTTFHQIVESCHEQIAMPLVKNTSLPIGDIANMLGYSDSHAFRQAFKRWTAKNPLEIRKVEY